MDMQRLEFLWKTLHLIPFLIKRHKLCEVSNALPTLNAVDLATESSVIKQDFVVVVFMNFFFPLSWLQDFFFGCRGIYFYKTWIIVINIRSGYL